MRYDRFDKKDGYSYINAVRKDYENTSFPMDSLNLRICVIVFIANGYLLFFGFRRLNYKRDFFIRFSFSLICNGSMVILHDLDV